MKTAFKILMLYCLTVAMLFSTVSCNQSFKNEETVAKKETSTQAITPQSKPKETTPEETTLEETIPEETTAKDVLLEPTETETTPHEESTPEEETSKAEVTQTTTVTEEITSSQEPEQETTTEETTTEETTTEETTTEETTTEETTTEETTTEKTTTEETTTEEPTPPEPPHEHVFVEGQGACGETFVVEKESVFDNNNDGKNDVFCFSPRLPDAFEADDAIVWLAGDYYPKKSSNVGKEFVGNTKEECWFCKENTATPSYIYYVIEVPESGTYKMAIYTVLDDEGAVRGAKYTVNDAYSFETSYQFASNEELDAVVENENSISSYMFGMQIELQAGVNTIKIESASNIENNQQFRAFYFVKVANA